jgi:GT2 family glycosyltransferase
MESERDSEHTSPAAHDDVLLICVNYLKPAETQRFVSTVLDQALSSSLRLAVVDNSPSPGAGGVLESLKSEPRVRAIATGKNLGYFGGAAAALGDHLKTHSMPEWVIVSNPDVYFPDRNVLQRLCDVHRGDEPAVIAPSIRTVDSSVDQNPYMRVRPSRFRMHLYRWIFSAYPIDVVYQGLSWIKHRALEASSRERPAPPTSQPEKIYAPHGAFIALHRSYFERGGNLEHGAFLFGEEIFVAETVRRLGMTVLYEPALLIEHTERSTAAGLFNRQTSRYRRQASRYLARTFF